MKKFEYTKKNDIGNRQVMLNDNYEIYEKHGITKSNIMLHYHNFYEIIHILDGTFITHIDGYEYRLKAGDFLLIDAAKLHRPNFDDEATHNNHRIILWISKDMLENLSDNNTSLKKCFSYGPAFHFPVYETRILSKLLINILIKENDYNLFGNNLLIKSYFTEFFILLSRLCIENSFTTPQNNFSYSLSDKISLYIDNNIEKNISMDELAEYVYMSKYYFLRKFKAETTITAHDFLIHKRLIKACELIDEGILVSKVYEKCGFSDYSSFFRNFKKYYGISPKEYTEKTSLIHY